jgi:very-short-patch-repair endonuclease
MTDSVTIMSDFHVAVIKWLEQHGIEVMEEVDFPPYRVDIYVQLWHAAIEVDGPYHSTRADIRRDEELARVYRLEVFHVTTELFADKERLARDLRAFMADVAVTQPERWMASKDKTPWL